jgi:hypothetical protein
MIFTQFSLRPLRLGGEISECCFTQSLKNSFPNIEIATTLFAPEED